MGAATDLNNMISCVSCCSVQYDDIRLMRDLPRCLANWENQFSNSHLGVKHSDRYRKTLMNSFCLQN